MRATWVILALAIPLFASAQSFTNTASGSIDDNTFCAGGTNANNAGVVNDLERTFTVSGLNAISDLNLGLVATHTWRGDMDVRLESPAGTEIQLISPDTSAAGNLDDYNIELSDENLEPVNTGSHATANDINPPYYEFFVQPDNALSGFDGEDPNGTWTLKICDDYTGEIGNFIRGELIFQPTTGADLSLLLVANNETPGLGNTVTLTLTANSEGPQNSTPTAQLNLPPGANFISSSGDGTYNNGTGVWSIGSGFTPGTPRTLTVVISLPTAGSFLITAEILSSNQADPDSTPNNGIVTEDDYGDVTLNVQPSSTPPILNCPLADQFQLAFGAPGNTNGWPSTSTAQSYLAADPVSSTNINLNFLLSGDIGFLSAVSGTNSPVSQNGYTGGISPAEYSVGIAADFSTTAQFVTMEVDIGAAGVGVEALQFTLFDVDFGGWTDRIQVRGFMNATPVTPFLTPSAQNFISGNEAIGQNGNADLTSGAGNVTVTFNQPVDRIEWDYGNAANAGPDPAFQVSAMHTINMCGRRQADLTATKTVEVYDPTSLGLYMTPGNEILYKITVTNSATATAAAEDVDISDTLPENLKFVSATTTGFTGGAFGTPDLPAANTDCETTPCVVRFSGAEVAPNTTAEISVRAIIK